MDILKKYTSNNRFLFKRKDNLNNACNAPKDGAGVYLVYDVSKERNLIYIGSSGKLKNDGRIKGRLFDRLVKGKQFKEKRRKSWPLKMNEDNIEIIEICWYETFHNNIRDLPSYVEGLLIQDYYSKNNCLPKWNKAF